MPRWRELAGEIVDTPPIGVEASLGGSGVDQVGSARDQLVKTHPKLQGKRVALIGFRVRHGDVIDALTPIYAEVTETLELVGEYEGKRIGGTGGGETLLTRPGHVVTGFNVQRGHYFGRSEVVHFQVLWTVLTPDGIDPDATLVSERLGTGANRPPGG